MAIRRLVIRASAVGFSLIAGGVYAASAGLIPLPGRGAAPPVATAAPTPIAPAPATPGLLAQQASLSDAASEATGAGAAGPVPVPVPIPVPIAEGPAPLDRETSPEGDMTLASLADDPVPTPLPTPAPVAEEMMAAPTPLTDPEAATDDDVALSPFGLPCTVDVTATPLPMATVGVDILAPCMPGARVEIAHSGLSLTLQTDAMGLLTLDIPAFESPAFFEVTFPDDSVQTALVALDDLDGYSRVGLAWQGDRALELHAMEAGAAFGAAGHVWRDAPGGMDDVIDGTGGHIVLLGDATLDDPMLAQVYTVSTAAQIAGDVAISIDAPVTEANCGLPTDAVTLRRDAGEDVTITPLSFTTPGCDAIGDILVLQNLMGPLRLASN